MAAVPVEPAVLCLHCRADDEVPFAYSERYVAAAAPAGSRARLHETDGDHFTLIDPHSADWRVAADAPARATRRCPAVISRAGVVRAGEVPMQSGRQGTDKRAHFRSGSPCR